MPSFWPRPIPFRHALAIVAFLICAASTGVFPTTAQAANSTAISYAARIDTRNQANQIAADTDLDAAWVKNMLDSARYLPNVPPLMIPKNGQTARDWTSYRKNFLDPARIRAGVRFWQRNRRTLERAQAQFGVPPEIIVGILGVETIYGQNVGNIRVIDALSTLSFDFPSAHPRAQEREAYFRNELKQYLLLAKREGFDPLQARGSYAGAMGLPQFMPSSWEHYAIDFDDDGHIDLWHSEADAIGSVANYFKAHGWRAGEATHFDVSIKPDADMKTLLEKDILPSFSHDQMDKLGATVTALGRLHAGPLALVELQNGDPSKNGRKPDYVAGTDNFYVVTRYNQSSYYAMAVIQLGQAIARQMNG